MKWLKNLTPFILVTAVNLKRGQAKTACIWFGNLFFTLPFCKRKASCCATCHLTNSHQSGRVNDDSTSSWCKYTNQRLSHEIVYLWKTSYMSSFSHFSPHPWYIFGHQLFQLSQLTVSLACARQQASDCFHLLADNR